MDCFITDGEGRSAEICFIYRGEVYHRFLHPTRTDAEQEATEKYRELTQVGWSDQPRGAQSSAGFTSAGNLRR
jgi:hypothetical protein